MRAKINASLIDTRDNFLGANLSIRDRRRGRVLGRSVNLLERKSCEQILGVGNRDGNLFVIKLYFTSLL